MNVPFIDLTRSDPARDEAVEAAVLRVLEHRRFILGPEVEAFEERMGAHLDGAHVIGVSSGTDALLVGLMAAGVGHGDRVVTTPFSFFATAGVISRLGATPVFCDIDPVTMQIDPARLASMSKDGVRVVIPVHLFGDLLPLDEIDAWAGDDVVVVEDAAQAIGARDAEGRPAGTVGAMGAFSFFPTKNLGALGDAGMVVTRDDELAEKLRCLRAHGQTSRYHHEYIGGNFRIDALQAAALAASLPWLEEITQARQANGRRYHDLFAEAGFDDGRLIAPRHHDRHTYHQFVVRIPGDGDARRRDAVAAGLRHRGIGCAVYYPEPFHLQPCFRSLGYERGSFPEAELACAEALALPIFPGLRAEEQEAVVAGLRDVL